MTYRVWIAACLCCAMATGCKTGSSHKSYAISDAELTSYVDQLVGGGEGYRVAHRRASLTQPGSQELLVIVQCTTSRCDRFANAPRFATALYVLDVSDASAGPRLVQQEPVIVGALAQVDVIRLERKKPQSVVVHAKRQGVWGLDVYRGSGLQLDTAAHMTHDSSRTLWVEDLDGDGVHELLLERVPELDVLLGGDVEPAKRKELFRYDRGKWVSYRPVSPRKFSPLKPRHAMVMGSPCDIQDAEALMQGYDAFRQRSDMTWRAPGMPERQRRDALEMLSAWELLSACHPKEEEVRMWSKSHLATARTLEELIAMTDLFLEAAERVVYKEVLRAQIAQALGAFGRASPQERAELWSEDMASERLTDLQRAWWGLDVLSRRAPKGDHDEWLVLVDAMVMDLELLKLVSQRRPLMKTLNFELFQSPSWEQAPQEVARFYARTHAVSMMRDFSLKEPTARFMSLLKQELKTSESLPVVVDILKLDGFMVRRGVSLKYMFTQVLRVLDAQKGAWHDVKVLKKAQNVLCTHVHHISKKLAAQLTSHLILQQAVGTMCDFSPGYTIEDDAEFEAWSDRMLWLLEWMDVHHAISPVYGAVSRSSRVERLSPANRERLDALVVREKARVGELWRTMFERAPKSRAAREGLLWGLSMIRMDDELEPIMKSALDSEALWNKRTCELVYGAVINRFNREPSKLSSASIESFRARCGGLISWSIVSE